jgi:hypothetical protein
MPSTSLDAPARRRGASPETLPSASFVSSKAQQAAAAARDGDDDDLNSTSPSKRKKLPQNLVVVVRSHRAAAGSINAYTTMARRHRQWSSMVYLAAILLCGILTLMNLGGSESMVHESVETIQRWEELSALPSTMDTKPQHQQQQHQSRKSTTLALLYPPGLLGGYRNQVIRFISLCVHATEQNLTQLLLPSLLWSTQVQVPAVMNNNSSSSKGGGGWNTTATASITTASDKKAVMGPWQPIPMEWVFDVDYWNEYAYAPAGVSSTTRTDSHHDGDSRQRRLPTLVRVRDLHGSDCWENLPLTTGSIHDDTTSNTTTNTTNEPLLQLLSPLQRAVWQQGTLGPLSNVTQKLLAGQLPKFNPRKQDFLPFVQHCQNPVVYGGGKPRGSGRLWNDYMGYRKNKKAKPGQKGSSASSGSIPYQQDVNILRALRPAPVWRAVGQQCVQRHVGIQHANDDTTSSIKRRQQETTAATTTTKHFKYLALHARIELDMLAHACGKDMEWNLTKIIDQVQELAASARTNEDDEHGQNVQGLFVAVSRSGMQSGGSFYREFRALDRLVRGGGTDSAHHAATPLAGDQTAPHKKKQLPVFECGESMLQEYYQAHPDVPDHGSLLQSVVNFDIAVNADIFVGVRKSSYSVDVWTTRFHQGRGASNYEYTKTGTRKIENGGLPPPHINCK